MPFQALARCLAALTSLHCALAQVSPTQLRLHVQDRDGNPAAVEKAQLLLVAWGGSRRIELPADGPRVEVTLDAQWLRSRFDRFADLERAYLLVQAAASASLRSQPFAWIGSGRESPPASTSIEFPGNDPIPIVEGRKQEAKVVVRPVEERFLELRDSKGEPMAGVRIRMGMFWSAANHCGSVVGSLDFPVATSDSAGLIPAPDGDFPYALEILTPHIRFRDPAGLPVLPPRLVSDLKSGRNLLRLERLPSQELLARILRSGQPAAGEILIACIAHCPCGACCGPIARAGADGRAELINIDAFHPAAYEKVMIRDQEGAVVWQADPRSWQAGQTIVIELPSGIP